MSEHTNNEDQLEQSEEVTQEEVSHQPSFEIESFEDLIDIAEKYTNKPFNDNILRGIYNYGYEKPSRIQQSSIAPMIIGNDMIAQAPSGTGKTAAFTVGLLQHIDDTVNVLQSIVIAPTRELAGQIDRVITAISQHMNIKTCLCVGGITKTRDNIDQIKKEGRHIAIGTPGRLNDLIKRKALPTAHVKTLVMDEVDELLRDGFVSQIETIVNSLENDETYICLFSATLSPQSMDITNKFLRNPVNILVEREKLSLDGIQQYTVDVRYDNYKIATLMDLYKHLRIAQSIIFVNSIEKSIEVKNEFTTNDYSVSVINGSLSPEERENVMKEFRQGNIRVLIATDVISRGIDVQQVNVVINYDIPTIANRESYLHRIGRSGRYGRKGLAINFVTDKSKRAMNIIYSHYGIKNISLPPNIAELI